jgi:flagellar biosynthetic protein FlhB
MAEKDGRTEKATGKRKRESRNKGQVAKSQDINHAVGLMAVFAVLIIGAPRMLSGFESMLSQHLSTVGNAQNTVTNQGLEPMIRATLETFLVSIAPVVAAAAVAGVVANIAQVKFKWTFAAIKPKFNVLNPVHGIKKVFGMNGLVETGKALVKLSVIGGVAFMAIWSDLPQLGSLVGIPPNEILSQVGNRVESIALRVIVALMILSIGDMIWQRKKLAKSMMMTKEEVKQEGRQADIAPELRGAIRRKQFQMSRRRMLAGIPTADVVVVNPTHFAVALRYDEQRMRAPLVVAKGQDLIAARIREIATEHSVPIFEAPPLARVLHRNVDIGAEIPTSLYQSVAQVLTYIYQLKTARRTGIVPPAPPEIDPAIESASH